MKWDPKSAGTTLLGLVQFKSSSINRGQFSVVKTARSVQTGEIHAVKVVDKSRVHDMIDLKNEISILYRLQNANIVRLHEAFETKTHVSLVMER